MATPILGNLTTQPVFPLTTYASIVLESWPASPRGAYEGRANLLVGDVSESTQLSGRKELPQTLIYCCRLLHLFLLMGDDLLRFEGTGPIYRDRWR